MKFALALAALGTLTIATPAAATIEVAGSGNTGCATAPLAPGADKCVGFYSGNEFSGKAANVALQQSAINLLLGAGNLTVDWNALKNAGKVVSNSDVDKLNELLATAGGQVLLGLHWGNVPGDADNVSAFYLWDNVKVGTISLTNTGGYSNAVLYRSAAAVAAVPEPGTWALMLIGFGAAGASLRRRRRHAVIPQFA